MPRLRASIRNATPYLRQPHGRTTIKVLRAPCDFNFETSMK
jgi:hypothetical protein